MTQIGELTRSHVARKVDSALTTAKGYADTKAADTLTKARSYADDAADSALIDAKDYADTTLEAANSYTDVKIADLVDGAPETLDTLKEIADELAKNETAMEAITAAVQNHTHAEATDKKAGFMSAEDKAKLDTGSMTVTEHAAYYFADQYPIYTNAFVGSADDFADGFDTVYNA